MNPLRILLLLHYGVCIKFILLLTLIFSPQAYAQDDSKGHKGSDNKERHEQKEGMHGGGHDHDGEDHGGGGMHGGGHRHGHKLDETRLKQFFEPLPETIIDEEKNAALI